MASNYKVSTDIDTLLRKSTKEEVAAFLGLDANTANIATNTANIATNTANIATNTADIATNTADIATNTADIATNAINIATNASNIVTNNAEIVTNTADITTNAANIATNAANIATNTADIATKAPISEPTILDKLTITADKTPDENAVLEMVDKSTAANRKGALEKKDGILYVGASDLLAERWRFQHEPSVLSLNFPTGAGMRLGLGGSFLNHYSEGFFNPTLESGDGSVVQNDYAVRQANYVRIGDFVHVNIYMSISDFTSEWKVSIKNWRVAGLPYEALGNHNIEVRPLKGWLNLGNDNITGALNSGNNYLWIERFIDFGSTAGVGTNTARISATAFTVHPFDFTADVGKSFDFVVTGSYRAKPE